MRHRIEAGAAKRGRGFDIVAIMIAGQKSDGHLGAGSKIVAQLPELMTARGDFDGGAR
jgi:hypothetical protein